MSELLSSIAAVSLAMEHRNNDIVQSIHQTADEVMSHFGQLCERLIADLGTTVLAYQKWGIPPSFIHVAGQGGLEKPFNRLFAWWADVNAEHGMAREFLGRLAELTAMPMLAEDLEMFLPEVRAEESIKDVSGGRMPDFVVRTERAALLLENKVKAGQSGSDQFETYHNILRKWADERFYKAFLVARDVREVPPGWDGMITHQQLAAEVFEPLWNMEAMPIWGRIAAKITEISFRNETREHRTVMERIKRLLRDYTENGNRLPVSAITELESLRSKISDPDQIRGGLHDL